MFQIKQATNVSRRKLCLPVQRWLLGVNTKSFICIWSFGNNNTVAFTEFSVTSRSCAKVIPSMAREKCWRTLQWHAFYDKATLASQKDSIWARFTLMRRNNHSQIPVAIDATVLRQSSATYIQTLSPHSSLPGLCNVIVSIAWEKNFQISITHENIQRKTAIEIQGDFKPKYFFIKRQFGTWLLYNFN